MNGVERPKSRGHQYAGSVMNAIVDRYEIEPAQHLATSRNGGVARTHQRV